MNALDLSFDCIADLFQRDEKGNYIQLQAYFRSISLDISIDDEVLIHLRRLVFSKVNQGMFRLFSEIDPTLGKIIRNIKIAIHTLKNFNEVERFGETCIFPSACDTLEEYPVIDNEDLKQHLFEFLNGCKHIPEMLAKLSLFLRTQNEYCRIVPLITVAIIFRLMYNNRIEANNQIQVEDNKIFESETLETIKRMCERVKQKNYRKYVGKKNIPSEIFEKYFTAIEKVLCESIVSNNGDDCSLYENLSQLLPSMTELSYHKNHRNKVEYFMKQVKKELKRELKSEY